MGLCGPHIDIDVYVYIYIYTYIYIYIYTHTHTTNSNTNKYIYIYIYMYIIGWPAGAPRRCPRRSSTGSSRSPVAICMYMYIYIYIYMYTHIRSLSFDVLIDNDIMIRIIVINILRHRTHPHGAADLPAYLSYRIYFPWHRIEPSYYLSYRISHRTHSHGAAASADSGRADFHCSFERSSFRTLGPLLLFVFVLLRDRTLPVGPRLVFRV